MSLEKVNIVCVFLWASVYGVYVVYVKVVNIRYRKHIW